MLLRPARGRVLRSRQSRLRARAGALRDLVGVHLRNVRAGAPTDTRRVSRADGLRTRRLSLSSADGALLISLRGERKLEAIHGRVPGVLSRARAARKTIPDRDALRGPGSGF